MKYKKSAVVLIYNSQNKLALQLRAAHDTSYPSHWDFSAAGGIDVMAMRVLRMPQFES